MSIPLPPLPDIVNPITDADLDRIADAVPVDDIGVHITTWHRRFARAVLSAAGAVREPLRDDAFHAWVEEVSADHQNLLERQEFRNAMYNAWINGYNTRVDEQAHGIGGGK